MTEPSEPGAGPDGGRASEGSAGGGPRPDSASGGGTARPAIELRPSSPPPPPPGSYSMHPPPPSSPPPRRGWAAAVIGGVVTSLLGAVLVGSLLLNLSLGALVLGSLEVGPRETVYEDGDRRHRLVILPIEGLIDDRTSSFIHQAVQALRDNPPKAVILRVDSGGGFVAPSDRIWKHLADLRAETGIPMVASFGASAASGGYYVAASADTIVAEPTCITGSIGVIAQAFTFDDLLEKVGVTPEVVTSSDSTRKDLLNPMRPWTEDDRVKLRSVLDTAYERFVAVVHQGRGPTAGLTVDDVRALATGEFFTTSEAIALRLVDREGYLGDAIEEAKTRAGIPAHVEPRVMWLGPPRGFGLGGVLGSRGQGSLADITADELRSRMLELGTPALLYGSRGH